LTESHVFYTRHAGGATGLPTFRNTKIHQGYLTLEAVNDILGGRSLEETEFYFCGPEGFMVHFEGISDGLNVGVEVMKYLTYRVVVDRDMEKFSDAEVVAVGSRNQATADAFGN
jgi:ferredoxin-NADP reductase